MSQERFRSLPDTVRRDLDEVGLGETWFASHDVALVQTVLNLYVKLQLVDLWSHVEREAGPTVGSLNVFVRDAERFRAELISRRTSWLKGEADGFWECRELRFRGSLHVKHFDGWPPNKVQTHVDPSGALLVWPWWIAFPVPLFQLARHALEGHAYLDHQLVRHLTRSQGGDPRVLG